VPGPAAIGPAALAELLRRGRTDLTVHVPRGFARAVLEGRRPDLAVTIDGTNSSIAGRAGGYAQAVLVREARRALAPEIASGTARVAAESRFLYNPELESRIYMVPGVMVMLVTIIAAFVTGMAVVREKEIGTLEQVMVTPLGSFQFVLGKTIPFALIALFDLVLATLFAMWWFGVPFLGSPLVLLLGVLGYLVVTLGLGLLASAVSHTQQQAVFTVWFYLVFAILLSGFFFPIQNMPDWARQLTLLNPMRFFMNVIRGVLLKGAGLDDVVRDILVLFGMGALSYGAAVAAFRRTSG
jgi:ABC-2 type transport system permease protein